MTAEGEALALGDGEAGAAFSLEGAKGVPRKGRKGV